MPIGLYLTSVKPHKTRANTELKCSCVFSLYKVKLQKVLCYIQPEPGEDILLQLCLLFHLLLCVCQCSAGIRRRLLEGAVGGSIQHRSVGSQHVASWVLGGSLRLWLGGSLGGLLALALLRGAEARASISDHLGSSRCLVAAGMLWGRRRR